MMLEAIGEVELGELMELFDDDVKEIPRPSPMRLQKMIVKIDEIFYVHNPHYDTFQKQCMHLFLG